MNEKSALIAMSGGVDSSSAAFLMREQGYECMGTTMRLYRNEDLGACNFRTCCSEKDIEDASEVAFQLDIPYEVLDFTADFQEQIIDKFIRTYEEGGTPNPCIDCNRFMKFEKLLDFAFAHGLNYIVTGHYARIERDEQSGRYVLKKGVDEGKDQSYVLYNLTRHQLAHTIFPLGAYSKTEIREMAEKQNWQRLAYDSQISASCRRRLQSRLLWSSTPASITRRATTSTSKATRSAHTRARCATPSASGEACGFRWATAFTSAARTWKRTRSRSARRAPCSLRALSCGI